MTKKDYIKIADVFIEELNADIWTLQDNDQDGYQKRTEDVMDGQVFMIDRLLVNIINVLQNDNPKFDAVRFKKYILDQANYTVGDHKELYADGND